MHWHTCVGARVCVDTVASDPPRARALRPSSRMLMQALSCPPRARGSPFHLLFSRALLLLHRFPHPCVSCPAHVSASVLLPCPPLLPYGSVCMCIHVYPPLPRVRLEFRAPQGQQGPKVVSSEASCLLNPWKGLGPASHLRRPHSCTKSFLYQVCIRAAQCPLGRALQRSTPIVLATILRWLRQLHSSRLFLSGRGSQRVDTAKTNVLSLPASGSNTGRFAGPPLCALFEWNWPRVTSTAVHVQVPASSSRIPCCAVCFRQQASFS